MSIYPTNPATKQVSPLFGSSTLQGVGPEANTPPEFWTEVLSRAWQGVSLVCEEGKPSGDIEQFGKVDCVECFEPAVGLCNCCRSSWCAEHLAEHEAGIAVA